MNAETILLNVKEYQKLNKGIESLDLIYSYIVENQIKQQWTHDFEKLILIVIDLAVKHDKHAILNESLEIYKTLCEKHNFESLFLVFDHYIKTLTEKFNKSFKKIDNSEEMFLEL